MALHGIKGLQQQKERKAEQSDGAPCLRRDFDFGNESMVSHMDGMLPVPKKKKPVRASS